MNKTKRKIIIIYCCAIAIVCLIVPWRAEIKGETGSLTASLGYSPIFWPPTFNGYEPGNFVSVDYARVVLEIIAITVLTVMIIVIKQRATGEKNNDEKS